MNNTPNANRKHIAIYGKRNAGKSSLLNAIIGQDISLVSSVKGTTTDPVTKAIELIPLGPVVFIDTAGIDDKGELGELRVKKSLKILQRTDFAIYVTDIKDIEDSYYKETIMNFKKYNIPYITVINKIDTVTEEVLEQVRSKFKDAIFVSALKEENILFLKDVLIKRIQEDGEEKPIIGDLLRYDSKVVMVVPIDSEAPKGRIILPQVQLIRDCLDNGIKSYVVRDTELQSALEDIKDVDLVVTDSQAFKRVNEIVPRDIKLTSFSILFARYKGELGVFLDGISKIKDLNENSKILISESCTHNHSHEDIGRVKIPMMLREHTGKNLKFDFKMGHDFPEDISEYDLVIHCGACMVNRKTMLTRIDFCKKNKVNITNYGVLLAHLTGILDRSIEIFNI
ncbi:[FeFe] hydrogenase H-cluster maturation GTPase HydF [Clostridium brassicae]|uniref:[FeFe] hydrogenase H-cluster maturation GTPase HydF n=1 Tax=Clostridium brassicae TaxID=2999072 RepID=A0ABT4DHA5_9CLOT|nr:[FeFe] hydrogenase H-cluster maturation GTPase HydF [Clostridium brassicae]MCY6960394.1 [FeFe] hydrogenase H-cluster maturation GTPase HydF [Clostridium brassicae]